MDMLTLAALLGHSKLNMVLRYAHPQERHQADAVKMLEAANAAKEIAEAERMKKAGKAATVEVVTTLSAAVVKAPQEAEAVTH